MQNILLKRILWQLRFLIYWEISELIYWDMSELSGVLGAVWRQEGEHLYSLHQYFDISQVITDLQVATSRRVSDRPLGVVLTQSKWRQLLILYAHQLASTVFSKYCGEADFIGLTCLVRWITDQLIVAIPTSTRGAHAEKTKPKICSKKSFPAQQVLDIPKRKPKNSS